MNIINSIWHRAYSVRTHPTTQHFESFNFIDWTSLCDGTREHLFSRISILFTRNGLPFTWQCDHHTSVLSFHNGLRLCMIGSGCVPRIYRDKQYKIYIMFASFILIYIWVLTLRKKKVMIAGDAVELFVRKTCRNVVMLHVLVIYLRIKFKTTTTTTRTKKVHMQKSIHVLTGNHHPFTSR